MKHLLACHPILKSDFVEGHGCFLYDKTGRPYLDCESGVWCTGLGHSHPHITAALQRQAQRLTHIGFRWGTQEMEQAAVALLDILDFAGGKCVFLCSGSEAMDLALRLAQIVSHRNRLVCLEPSYLAAFGQGADIGGSRWISIERQAEHIERTIDWLQIAAFVLEPGSAGGSVHFPCRKLVQTISQQVQRSGGLVVVDDVTTGMGRTGEWFGYSHFDIHPDIVAVGKGLGNGYPISAVAVRREVAEQIEATGLHYVQSHQNDPLGCAVASAVIEVMRAQDLIQQSQSKGQYLRKQLDKLKQDHTMITEIRGQGLMVALALTNTVKAGDIFEALLDRGFLVGCNPSFNCIRLMPPLIIEQTQIDALMAALKDVLC